MAIVIHPIEEGAFSDYTPKTDEDEEMCWPPWCPNWKIFTLQFSLTVGDMFTDLRTAWNYFQSCHFLYGSLTLFFIVLQSLPTAVDFLKVKICEIRRGEFTITPLNKKSKSFICGVLYLVLICLLYVAGGFIFLSVFQILQTIFLLLRLCWEPPGKNGELTKNFQRKAFVNKFVEVQLESSPQSVLQLVFLITYGFNSWFQIISVVFSIFSVAKGTVDSLIMMKNGNKIAPKLKESMLGIIAILPDTILRAFSYSSVLVFCMHTQGSLVLRCVVLSVLAILLIVFFLLTCLISDNFESFVFSLFSAISSPLLFVRNFRGLAPRNYVIKAVKFYSVNKLVTSILLMIMLSIVLISAQDRSMDSIDYLSNGFECSYKCSVPENVSCLDLCNLEQEQNEKHFLGISLRFTRLKIFSKEHCKNVCKGSEPFQILKDKSCANPHHVAFISSIFPILLIIGFLSICDSFSPILLFGRKLD